MAVVAVVTAVALAAVPPAMPPELLVAPSQSCLNCYLTIRGGGLNRIDRRNVARIGSTATVTPIAWNPFVSVLSAVELATSSNTTGVMAIGVDNVTNSIGYYWKTKAVRPPGCPAPTDARFLMFADARVYLLWSQTGAMHEVVYNTSTNNVKCIETSRAYPNTNTSASIYVAGAALADDCMWYAVWRNGILGIEAPGCNIPRISITASNDTEFGALLTVQVDLQERLLLLTGDPARAAPSGPYAAASQQKTNYAGKVLEIKNTGEIIVRAGGLCNPIAATYQGRFFTVADRGVSVQHEINEVDGVDLAENKLNFGWPIIEGTDGYMAFLQSQTFSYHFVRPVLIESAKPPNKFEVESAADYIIMTLSLIMIASGVALEWKKQLTKHETLLYAIMWSALLVVQVPCILEVPDYNATASIYGVVQSHTAHNGIWLGAFVGLVTLMVTALLAVVHSPEIVLTDVGLVAGLMVLTMIVLAGGARAPWRLSWVGWVLGVAAIAVLVTIATTFQRSALYRSL